MDSTKAICLTMAGCTLVIIGTLWAGVLKLHDELESTRLGVYSVERSIQKLEGYSRY